MFIIERFHRLGIFMATHSIHAKGVRTHNLKNIEVQFPREKLIVITGLSGSGKSSLAFDTLYAEGQRRYVESLSAYARQFLSMMEKPDVDWIEGLSPAISIEQKATSHNPRSTVGTITEIYDYLRLLYARVGTPQCPEHGTDLTAQTVSQMVDALLALDDDTALMILAPVIRDRKGEHAQLFAKLQAQGFIRARVNGELHDLDQPPQLDLRKKHTIEVVVDRVKVRENNKQRLAESIETALNLADGLVNIAFINDSARDDLVFSANFACPQCGYSIEELAPRCFSFNNPKGACPDCEGLGVSQYFDESKLIVNEDLSLSGGAVRGWDKRNTYFYQLLQSLAKHYQFSLVDPYKKLPDRIKKIILHGNGGEKIDFTYSNQRGGDVIRRHSFEGVIPNMERRYVNSDSFAVKEDISQFLITKPCRGCDGSRLRRSSRFVFVADKDLPAVTQLSIKESLAHFSNVKLTGRQAVIAEKILKEIVSRLEFLVDVGLDYLSLSRSAETLSGGEAQRIRLASQIGSGLVGVMYILDEPSIGLHQRDNDRLLKTLVRLRDLGNTVIVVEHDEDAILVADHVIDLGPGAGVHGGEIVASGSPKKIMQTKKSLTGQYLCGEKKIEIPKQRVPATCRPRLKLEGASLNNLHDVSIEIPLGLMTCVTGVCGLREIVAHISDIISFGRNRIKPGDHFKYRSV